MWVVGVISLVVFLYSCESDNDSNTDSVPKHTNQLAKESSPYLLQHAHNPVNWYPWGEEALYKAKSENKLLIISVGYAACHWCHVMEKESFEDEEVAQFMNENFVCIKVDREERPDIDQVYMDAVQLISGSGGWPLNCFALPDGKPIYGGTYFGRNQWLDLMKRVAVEYQKNPDKLAQYASDLIAGVDELNAFSDTIMAASLNRSVLDSMVYKWTRIFDYNEGGFTYHPKFPLPNNMQFLMRYAELTQNDSISQFVYTSLKKMAYGGLYDHLAGGFARYSTDEYWKVPHFEKMLYDNGQLVSLYSEAYEKYHDPFFKQVVEQTIAFCEIELSNGEGAYYSSLDADSEGEEGKFYVWTSSEIKNIVKQDSEVVFNYYNVNGYGKWEGDKNILIRSKQDSVLALEMGLKTQQLEEIITRNNKALLENRNQRTRPNKDDKSLTSWNALMLSGLLDAYSAFGNKEYLKEAEKTANFIISTQRKADGGLFHSYKNGESSINGFLEDYAFSIEALIRMYELTFDEKWLMEAKNLADYSIDHFFDQESQMFFFTSNNDVPLISRKTDFSDNVMPSSNSSMANGLFKLGTLFQNSKYLQMSETMNTSVASKMKEYGSGYSHWANLSLNLVFPYYEVAVTGEGCVDKSLAMNSRYIPNKIRMGGVENSSLPLLDGKFLGGEALYFVCYNKTCQLPTEDLNIAYSQMK